MEPFDEDNYNRHDALALAVQYHQVREASPEDVTETAATFLDWLNNYREEV